MLAFLVEIFERRNFIGLYEPVSGIGTLRFAVRILGATEYLHDIPVVRVVYFYDLSGGGIEFRRFPERQLASEQIEIIYYHNHMIPRYHRTMHDHGRTFTELSWLEIAHVFAELVGAHVIVNYKGGYSCSVDYHYTTQAGMHCCTGLTKTRDTADESAEWLMRQIFKYGSDLNFPGIKLPELQFESKDDLAVKLAAAGVDPEFSLTHRSG